MRQTDFQPEQLRQKIERLHTAGGRIDLHFLLDLVDEVSGGDGPSEPLARQIGLGLGNLYVYELLALLAEVQRELQQIVERLAGDISYKVYERARSMQIQLNDETPVAKIRQALEKNSSSGSDRRGLQLLGAALKILSVAVEAPK